MGIISPLRLKFRQFFETGHERTVKAKKNIIISFFLKGISIIIGFIILPITVKYVNPVQYGIWITIGSMITWFNFFDVGLGNGLKNKLTQAVALNKLKDAKIYVSTTYCILIIISLLLFLAFYVINYFLNWQSILNTTAVTEPNLNKLIILVFFFFCLQFILQLINIVLTANHVPFKVSVLNVIGQALGLMAIIVLIKTTQGSIFYLVFAIAGLPLLVQFVASIWFYSREYSSISPSVACVNFKYARNLLGVGGFFFIIQISSVVLFQTDNIVIAQIFGPGEVTLFNICYKLFSVVTMLFTILMTPFWSGFTEAYTKSDFNWIRSTMNKLKKYWMYISVLGIVILIGSARIYKIWIGNITIPFTVSLTMMVYVIGYCWLQINCYFLNGVGKIRMQFYLYIVNLVINIPLAIVLAKHIGLPGVILSNIITLAGMGIVLHIQSRKVINNTASGVWAK